MLHPVEGIQQGFRATALFKRDYPSSVCPGSKHHCLDIKDRDQLRLQS